MTTTKKATLESASPKVRFLVVHFWCFIENNKKEWPQSHCFAHFLHFFITETGVFGETNPFSTADYQSMVKEKSPLFFWGSCTSYVVN